MRQTGRGWCIAAMIICAVLIVIRLWPNRASEEVFDVEYPPPTEGLFYTNVITDKSKDECCNWWSGVTAYSVTDADPIECPPDCPEDVDAITTEWLGHVIFYTGNEQVLHMSDADLVLRFDNTTEIGLRSDGVVVWREKE